MNKIWKKAAALTMALAMLGSASALAACDNDPGDDDTHEHTFADAWTYDDTYHWHAATCGDTAEVKDKAEHDWEISSETEEEIVYTCECGATRTHEHTFAAGWTYDETDHWHAATCGDDVVSGKAAHTFGAAAADGSQTCTVCGYVHIEGHTHTFSEEWTYDENSHWHAATCGHDLRADEGPHALETVKEGSKTTTRCTVCGMSSSQYILEAERTYMAELNGAGYSGGAVGKNCAVEDYDENGDNRGDLGASGGYYVSYAYVKGFTLTFEFDSDRAVDDAVLIVRISSESGNPLELTDDEYLIQVNGEKVAYSGVSLPPAPNKLPFTDAIRIEGVHLQEGYNTIELITNNEIGMGGTMYETAPMVDCIKIETSAELDNAPYDVENFPPLYQ